MRHLNELRTRLRRESRGVVLLTGLHREPMLHAHGLLKLSRRLRITLLNADEVRYWIQARWRHGEVWSEPFDRTYAPGESISYVCRHPETVDGW